MVQSMYVTSPSWGWTWKLSITITDVGRNPKCIYCGAAIYLVQHTYKWLFELMDDHYSLVLCQWHRRCPNVADRISIHRDLSTGHRICFGSSYHNIHHCNYAILCRCWTTHISFTNVLVIRLARDRGIPWWKVMSRVRDLWHFQLYYMRSSNNLNL